LWPAGQALQPDRVRAAHPSRRYRREQQAACPRISPVCSQQMRAACVRPSRSCNRFANPENADDSFIDWWSAAAGLQGFRTGSMPA
jgi:hypothetical protein